MNTDFCQILLDHDIWWWDRQGGGDQRVYEHGFGERSDGNQPMMVSSCIAAPWNLGTSDELYHGPIDEDEMVQPALIKKERSDNDDKCLHYHHILRQNFVGLLH